MKPQHIIDTLLTSKGLMIAFTIVFAVTMFFNIIMFLRKRRFTNIKAYIISAVGLYILMIVPALITRWVFSTWSNEGTEVLMFGTMLVDAVTFGFWAGAMWTEPESNRKGIFNIYNNLRDYFKDMHSYNARIRELKDNFKEQTEWETLKNN